MKQPVFVSMLLAVTSSPAHGQRLTIQEPAQLIGKRVNVQRMPLCQPGTYTADLAHAGKQATVVSLKPNKMPKLPSMVMSAMTPELRDMMEDQQNAATLLLQFEDGTKLDTCAPIGPRKLAEYLELVPGETLEAISQVHPAPAGSFPDRNSADYLSQPEIASALSDGSGKGFVHIEDMGFVTPSRCEAQMPGLSVFTPQGLLRALSQSARKQYRKFTPDPEDTLKTLTVISYGCATGTSAGPVCESITRTTLLSDKGGRMVVEAIAQNPLPQSWQNGFGATAACSSLVSKFSLSDVQRVRNKKGEFLVATFNGPRLLKIYTVKEKHVKELGM